MVWKRVWIAVLRLLSDDLITIWVRMGSVPRTRKWYYEDSCDTYHDFPVFIHHSLNGYLQ